MLLMATVSLAASAQKQSATVDSTTFKGKFLNREYNVYIQLDAYHSSVKVPGQEIYGLLPGFFGDNQDGRKWLFTDVKVKPSGVAVLSIINDYGSEDLTATFTRQNDSTFVLRQDEGSTIKIARNHKWVKMPKVLTFEKTK